MRVPPYSEFGKACFELLYGARYGGAYQYDLRVQTFGKTTDGWAFTSTAVRREEEVDCGVKASFSRGDATVEGVASSSTLQMKASFKSNGVGLKGFVSAAFPYKFPPRVGLEFANEHVNVKGATELGSQPIVDFSVAGKYRMGRLGGDLSFDTARQAFSKWSLGLGYTEPNFQTCAYVMDLGRTAKITHSHGLGDKSMCGAELTMPIKGNNGSSRTLTVGYMRWLEDGNLVKAKLNSHGIVSALWEGKVEGGKVAFSGQVDVNDVLQPPRFGISLELGR